MQKFVYLCAPWIILLASFLILAGFYNSLPSEVIITRDIVGTGAILAPKSLFTVFRVPLIEVVCALAIEVMMIRDVIDETLADYNSMWRVLLFTVAFKSLLQTIETISPENTSIFFYATLAVVISGIVLAFFPGHRFFSAANRPRSKLSGLKKILLASLLVFYLGLAIVPTYIWR